MPRTRSRGDFRKQRVASTLARDAPSAMRNAISRRRPLNRTSNRLATLLQRDEENETDRTEESSEGGA